MTTRTDNTAITQETTGPRVVAAISAASSGAAATWAAAEAGRLRVPLQVVGAVPVEPNPAPLIAPDPRAMQRRTTMAQHELEAMADRLRGFATILPVIVGTGSPAATLLDHVDGDTVLLVLGHRDLTAAQRLLEGSTSVAIAGRSPVPVVVVPDSWEFTDEDRRPVVVGVSLEAADDGYRTDEAVVTAGFDRARALRVPLEAVHAWEVPALLSWSSLDITCLRQRVTDALEEVLAPWAQRYPDVALTAHAVAGRPAYAVEDASAAAQLVILGRHTQAHRYGGFHLGSTARAALHHAVSPTLVVPVSPEVEPRTRRPNSRDAGWAPMY